MHENSIAIIVLAAGNSSRMGSSKQLLSLAGETLLERAVNCALSSSAKNVLVVLGARANEHLAVIKHLDVSVTVNPDWALGIGNSLKLGVQKAMLQWPHTQALLVMVCDQPKLSVEHLNTLMETWRKENQLAVASGYSEIAGVPAVFDRRVCSDLLTLNDDRGAREVLKTLSEKIE